MILTIVHRLASNPMMNLLTGASNTTLAQAEVVEFQDDNSDVEELLGFIPLSRAA